MKIDIPGSGLGARTKKEHRKEKNFLTIMKIIDNLIDSTSAGNYPKDRIKLINELYEKRQPLPSIQLKDKISFGTFDIRGYTKLFSALSSEEEQTVALIFLSDFFDRASSEIEQTNGIVCKYIGDALFCYWLSPSKKHNPINVFYKIHKMFYKSLESLKSSKESLYYKCRKLGISSAISFGSAYYGKFGGASNCYSDFGLIGTNVNICFRVSKKAFKNQLYVIDSPPKYLNKYLVRKVSGLVLSGVNQPVSPFLIVKRKQRVSDVIENCHNSACDQLVECDKMFLSGQKSKEELPDSLPDILRLFTDKLFCSKNGCEQGPFEDCKKLQSCFYAFVSGYTEEPLEICDNYRSEA